MDSHHESSKAVLIAGPTASGKSALALELAQKTGGVIINADSMQVYRDLRVITARPTPEVYFKALTRGLSAVPPISPAIREGVRSRLERDGVEALHAELAQRDQATAERLKPRDRTRIARALEVVEATGRSLTDWHREGLPPLLPSGAFSALFLAPDRDQLYARIDARFDAMLKAGALEEVAALSARHLDPLLPAMKAHGVPALIRHLGGETTLAEAAEVGRANTRQYAKRQFTWFRHQLPEFRWVKPEAAAGWLEDVIPGRE